MSHSPKFEYGLFTYYLFALSVLFIYLFFDAVGQSDGAN